jgi:5-methylcytosine-specific restriction enzyme A
VISNFAMRQGAIGEGFIEADHLSDQHVEEGVAVHYGIGEDLSVLCSNSHRTIHRTTDPIDLAEFRAPVRFDKTDRQNAIRPN